MKSNIQTNKLVIGILSVFGIIIVFLVMQLYSVKLVIPTNVNIVAIFLTGLITGGLTCLAIQGGLLASTLATAEEEKLKTKATKSGSIIAISAFLVSKLVAYTIFGFLLGWFGSLFTLSLTAQIIMQMAVIIFMFGTAFNILNVHPIFRYFAIQPPRFITRRIRSQSKSKSIFAPAILGAFTVFIPCGTTQAMMALAIGAGSAFLGATIMFAFILGTIPLFFILGYFTTKLGGMYQRRFMKIAAVALILLAVFNLKNTLGLMGVNLSFAKTQTISQNLEATNNPTIEFTAGGYTPKSITVKAGTAVNLILKNARATGCIQAFVIPKLGISKIVKTGSTETVSFTAPNEKGQYAFMCTMGMYRGVINVI